MQEPAVFGAELEANEVECETGSTSADPYPIQIMPDGGSNITLHNSDIAPALGPVHQVALNVVGVWAGSSSAIDGVATAHVAFQTRDGGERRVNLPGAVARSSRKTLISESKLWDMERAQVLKEPHMHILWPDGSETPLTRIGGLYFVYARSVLHEPQTYHLSAREIGAEQMAHTLAARHGIAADRLQRLVKCVDGTGLPSTLSKLQRLAADQDTIITRTAAKRQPAPPLPEAKRSQEPGSTFHLDGAGPFAARSVCDGGNYEMSATDACSGYDYAASTVRHTTNDWIQFCQLVILQERKLRAVGFVITFRVDQAPELRSPAFSAAINNLGHLVELAPRNRYEGVTYASLGHNIVDRRAEGYLARAGKGAGFYMPARMHARAVLRLEPMGSSKVSRTEAHGYPRPDVSSRPVVTFGTDIAVYNEKNERGPSGTTELTATSGAKARTSEGIMMVYGPHYYEVLAPSGAVLRPAQVIALNEYALVCRGTPSGAGPSSDVGTQTLSPSELSAPAPAPSYFPPPMPSDAYLPADVVGPPSSRLRPRSVATLVEDVLQAAPPDELLEYFETALFQFSPGIVLQPMPDSNLLECSALDVDVPPLFALESCKAKLTHAQVRTDLGVQTITVPDTSKQVMNSQDSAEWIEAARRGANVLLLAGNVLMRRDVIDLKDIDVVGCVVQRKLKFEEPPSDAPKDAPRVLRKKNAYNARLCADETVLKMIRARRKPGAHSHVPKPVKAEIMGHMLLQMMLAHVAQTGASLARADVSTAYSKGDRTRPPVAMPLPLEIRDEFRDEDGMERLILLLRPHFGEEVAGDEWDATLLRALGEIGWRPAEGVPALSIADLAQPAQLGRLVDDMLISQAPAPDGSLVYDAYEQTTTLLGQRFGELTGGKEPTEFAGYELQRNFEIGAIHVTMRSHVEEAVAEHLPTLADGVRPSKSLRKGQSLHKLLDALRLPPKPERSTKLTPSQRRYQQVLGILNYPALCDPALVRLLAVAARVMCYPPLDSPIPDLLLERAWDRRHIGICYGGVASPLRANLKIGDMPACLDEPAPRELEGSSDATFHLEPADSYGILITDSNAKVAAVSRKIVVICEDSTATEGVAANKAAQLLEEAVTVRRALYRQNPEPPQLLSDNDPLVLLLTGRGVAARSRSSLRRYVIFKKRVKAGLIRPFHVADEHNPADFLTKWLAAPKLAKSLAYATNHSTWVAPDPPSPSAPAV